MRTIRLLAMLALPLLGGCLPKPLPGPAPVDPSKVPDSKAKPEDLVNYLNQEAARIQSVQASLAADAKSNGRGIGLSGNLACEKPRGFRLSAKVLGMEAVDLGSNNDEFWFWIKQAEPPYQYHCSYKELATGKVSIPFPFQPDMLMVAMGMAPYDPSAKYELKDDNANKSAGTLELSLDTVSPEGKPVKRTVVFKRMRARPGEPQVVGHIFRDSTGKIVCEAKVTAVHYDADSGASVPKDVELAWPEQKSSMKLMLSRMQVNRMDRGLAADLFVRRPIRGVRSFDLATRRVDGSDATTRASGER